MRLKSALRRGVAAAVIAGIVVSSGIPAYAKTWNIADGDITVKGASDESGNYNNVKQGEKDFEKDEGETVITGESDKNTVTIDDFLTKNASAVEKAYVLGGTYVFPNSLVDQICQLIA